MPHKAATATLPPQGTPTDEELTFISAPKARSYVKALTQVEVRLRPVAEGRGLLLGGTLCKDRAWFRAALAATEWVLHPLLPPVPCPWPHSPTLPTPLPTLPPCSAPICPSCSPMPTRWRWTCWAACCRWAWPVQEAVGPADQHAGVVLMQHPLLPYNVAATGAGC